MNSLLSALKKAVPTIRPSICLIRMPRVSTCMPKASPRRAHESLQVGLVSLAGRRAFAHHLSRAADVFHVHWTCEQVLLWAHSFARSLWCHMADLRAGD